MTFHLVSHFSFWPQLMPFFQKGTISTSKATKTPFPLLKLTEDFVGYLPYLIYHFKISPQLQKRKKLLICLMANIEKNCIHLLVNIQINL